MCRQRGRNPYIPAYLETQGKYVRLQSTKDSVQMVLENWQRGDTDEPKVTVYDCVLDSRKCMAFSFELENKKYFPVVTGDEISFEEQLKHKEKRFLFQWAEKTGQCLESVAEPNKYLSVKGSKITIQSYPTEFTIHCMEKECRRLCMTPIKAYPNTRNSVCICCKGRSTRRTVVTKMICKSESSLKRKTRSSSKYISVKRHNLKEMPFFLGQPGC
ncbi:uncharacterized protein [Misgurnus anguillicaudatus]|uniref:uncharacterized protein n=1 Tax=Misgurnus anguillicaudatus TaxID=75329 RepID=UPI003CCFB220